jgi:amino acid transporter
MYFTQAQGISRDTLPYKAPGQPYVTYVALVVAAIVTFFKGFDTFIKPSPSSTVPAFNYKNFITSYLGLPIFLIIFLGHRYYTGARTIASADVDLISGQREIEEDAREWVESEGKRNLTWYQKLWDGA